MTGSPPEPVLLVGPVSIDEIDGEHRLGGAVSYAASVVAAFGLRARILTTAAADTDLSLLAGHDLHTVPSEASLTFHFRATATGRELTILKRPDRPITAQDLPHDWTEPGTLLLGPLVANDVDVASFMPFAARASQVAVLTQGLQRNHPERAVPGPLENAESLIRSCSPRFSLFRSEREAGYWTEGQTAGVLARGARIVTTHGPHGAEVWQGLDRTLIPPAPSKSEIDATGAGDIFAAAFILALDEGDAVAGQLAAAFAAASVEHRGPGPLPTRAEIQRRLAPAGLVVDDGQRGALD